MKIPKTTPERFPAAFLNAAGLGRIGFAETGRQQPSVHDRSDHAQAAAEAEAADDAGR
jgi:hypothetical protein